jgi:hypothetical protein
LKRFRAEFEWTNANPQTDRRIHKHPYDNDNDVDDEDHQDDSEDHDEVLEDDSDDDW